jgi:hypothetical protein
MRVRRHEIVDEYAEDGRVAVFSSRHTVVVLSELATLAWSVIGNDWVEADAVTTALVEAFGSPGSEEAARVTTEQSLRALADRALLEIE